MPDLFFPVASDTHDISTSGERRNSVVVALPTATPMTRRKDARAALSSLFLSSSAAWSPDRTHLDRHSELNSILREARKGQFLAVIPTHLTLTGPRRVWISLTLILYPNEIHYEEKYIKSMNNGYE